MDPSENEKRVDRLTVREFELPPSSIISSETIDILGQYQAELQQYNNAVSARVHRDTLASIDAVRSIQAKEFYQTDIYRTLVDRYPVTIKLEAIGGVPCEVISPLRSNASLPRESVIINFHGGSFQYGARTNSRLESIPLASMMNSTVIAVDYRMAPKHQHPAATNDGESVYRAVLEQYSPGLIAVIGSSAGALLSSMLMVRLLEQKLPLPAAVGLIAGGAFHWLSGDFGFIGAALLKAEHGVSLDLSGSHPYFPTISPLDSAVFPGLNQEMLRRIPPSLLVSSTRDFALSSVVQTHAQLTKLGVAANLHIMEGLGHCFHYNSYLTETHDIRRITSAFFEKQFANYRERFINVG